jgi:hypothetical protein
LKEDKIAGPEPILQKERKPNDILFMDIPGRTALTGNLGSQQLKSMQGLLINPLNLSNRAY